MRKLQKNNMLFWVIFFWSAIAAQAQGITFENGTWDEVKDKAKKEQKYIFVDAFAEWCGPCKWMAAQVFTNESVGSFYNQHFISYKFDMEKGEGTVFATQYGVKAYPSFFYFSPEGELVHKTVGGKQVEPFIEDAKNALNPDKQLITLERRFQSGEKNPDFLYNYAMVLGSVMEDNSSILEAYFSSLDDANFVSEKTWKLVTNSPISTESAIFEKIATQKAKFYEIAGKKEVDDFFSAALMQELNTIISYRQADKIPAAYQKIRLLLDKPEAWIAKFDMYYYASDLSKAEHYLTTYSEDWEELNSAAWNLVEIGEKDKNRLDKGIKWAEKSIKIQRNYYNLDTYANLLFLLNKKKDARKIAKEAIELGKKEGLDVSTTEVLLEKSK